MALTPMMRQYLELKEKCKDCILFFRLGDFYEMFFEDAETASRELELVLTGRDCGLEKRAPMCGIPYHAANTYISRLVNKGYKIAICEQLEDPSLAKGIVKRDIIKIITPGTYMDSSFLSDKENNYLMSLYIDKSYNNFGICFADISTGEFNCTTGEFSISSILDEISKFDPKEIIIQEKINKDLLKRIKEKFNLAVTEYNNIYFEENSLENLKNQFSNMEDINFTDTLLNACNGLLKYILHTQKMSLSNITELNYYNLIDYLNIDINTRKNLELTESLNNKSKKGSLLWILDKTNTAMGARELKKWVEQPLLNKKQIENRLEAIEELMDNFSLHDDLKEALKDIYDIERLTGKISSKSVNAKELISLKNSIGNLPKVKLSLNKFKSNLLIKMFNELDELKDIYSLLDNAIDDNPSLSIKEGNIIKLGFNKEVDELKSIKSHGKEWIAKLETKEKEVTGIKSLKIGYNKVFGYYIDVTKTNINLVPEDRYIRKQTLSNSERYITEELKEMEEKILGAEEKLINLEYQLFVEVRDKIETEIIRLKSTAKIVSRIDCLSSLATIALDNNYSKPELNNKGYIKIEGGRHPVVEKMIPNGSFVQNDTFLNREENQLLLITGPNMAGKSTYMRQVALIVLMAQMGSFVPCEFADISICDKIFTRIGASDDLASGKSTFMVEMSEVSNILKNATKNSLILLDEVGRGTSTYDGLSIAWAVIEYICTNPELKCKTLFATHYHELTKLKHSIQGIKNYSIAVKKVDNDIIFLRKIIEGGTDKSYGIEVAKLAGLPNEVLNRANVILNSIESSNKNLSSNFESVLGLIEDSIINENNNELKDSNIELNKNNKDKLEEKTIKIENLEKQDELEKEKEELTKTESNDNIDDKVMEPIQIDFTEIEKEKLINKIKNIDILNMTPMEGFNKLYELIQKVKSL